MPRILLIDDETALLRLMNIYLSRLGYEVVGHSEVDPAVSALADSAAPFELMIADLSLFSSSAGLAELAASHPSVRVLVCSGAPFSVDSLPAGLQPRFAFLQKPFLPNMLASAVEQLLGKPL